MNGLTEFFFLAGLTCIVLHELDAIRQGEAAFFLGWTGASEVTIYRVFTALHAPLLLWMLFVINNEGFRVGLSAFLIIHMGLHIALHNHPRIRFDTWFSWLWIAGGAVCGAGYLLLSTL